MAGGGSLGQVGARRTLRGEQGFPEMPPRTRAGKAAESPPHTGEERSGTSRVTRNRAGFGPEVFPAAPVIQRPCTRLDEKWRSCGGRQFLPQFGMKAKTGQARDRTEWEGKGGKDGQSPSLRSLHSCSWNDKTNRRLPSESLTFQSQNKS